MAKAKKMKPEKFEYQGKRKDQVEFSYRVFVYSGLIIGSWLVVYLIYLLIMKIW